MIDTSPEHIVKRLAAERLHRMFWQGEHPIGGPRADVRPIVAEYYEVDTINQLKTNEDICFSIKATELNMTLRDFAESLRVEVITPILHLLHLNPSKPGSYRDKSKFISST